MLLALLAAGPAGPAAGGQARHAAGGQALRPAVVQVESDIDAFSLGPDLNAELAARQPWTAYEAELARRLRLGSTGTGFFVNARGDLVTNAHVVLSGVRYRTLPFPQSEWDSLTSLLTAIRDVWVTVGEGEQARCYVAVPVAIAEDLDLAVLRVALPPGDETKFSYLTIGSSDALRAGQAVTVLGFPENEFQASAGEILSLIYGSHVHEEMTLVRRGSGEPGQPPVTVSGSTPGPVVRLQHNAPTGHGSSGSPLLDAKNRVIGLAYATLVARSPDRVVPEPDLNLAIASDVIKRFLKSHAVPFTEAPR
jgi:S1-C subfamily serine protease